MNKSILSLAAALTFFISVQTTDAQVQLPPASSTQTVTQGLGIKTVTLTYQRPNTNGRAVFGDLVPYGEVWRTGANNIPTLSFEGDVSIEGHPVPAGTYGLFTIPNKDKWTVILSKNPKQWGSYQYSQEEDLLRFEVPATELTNKVETFTILFENATSKSTDLTLTWEKTKVTFSITVDQSAEILANIETAMKGEKKPYLQAAQYYLNNGLDIAKAVDWIELADQGASAPHIKYWKARILAKAGQKEEAKKAAQEGIDMATESNNTEYIKLNTQILQSID